MKKYLELFEGAFDSTVADKIKPENKPYVAYSKTEGVVYTVIPEELISAYQMVDLGLSVKWADRNVGATSPEDAGLYFSWGNVDGHAVDENGNTIDGYSFDSDTYAATSGGQYTGSTLDAEHDAATVNMGEEWRMPTVDETLELVQNTDQYCIDLSGNTAASYGSKLRSICFVKKGEAFDYNNRSNFIEFPLAGLYSDSLLSDEGFIGYIRSSSIADDYEVGCAHDLFASESGLFGDNFSYRYYGLSVRGVHA